MQNIVFHAKMEDSGEVRCWLEFSQNYKAPFQNTGDDMLGAYNNGREWGGGGRWGDRHCKHLKQVLKAL